MAHSLMNGWHLYADVSIEGVANSVSPSLRSKIHNPKASAGSGKANPAFFILASQGNSWSSSDCEQVKSISSGFAVP